MKTPRCLGVFYFGIHNQ